MSFLKFFLHFQFIKEDHNTTKRRAAGNNTNKNQVEPAAKGTAGPQISCFRQIYTPAD